EHFETLGSEFDGHIRDAVAAGPRQTFDQTRCNWIASRFGRHDWNGCRGILGGDGCRTAKGQDNVYVARHEILGKLWQLFPAVPAGTEFELHIAIGDVALPRQSTHNRT